MDKETYELVKKYPLDLKVEMTKRRIQEWYEYWNGEVYVSFSGGKDSTVLLDIVRQLYPDVVAVFSDTGLEFPELKAFVKKKENVVIVRPDKGFKEIIETKGYPIVSKEVANCVRLAKKNISDGKEDTCRVKRMRGIGEFAKGSVYNCEKWAHLLDAPFDVTEECCNELKKKPFKKFEKEFDLKPMVGTLAEESRLRKTAFLKLGCNAFDNGKSTPLGFWTNQDILQYIKQNDLEIASVYGDIVEDDKGKLTTTGESRTGCIFCCFGVHLEKGENRFQRLKKSHPNLYDYSINKLGIGEVLDYIDVEY